ncbi:MAG: BamA/TamA family outer membrane protein [Muribaculaceae bacterium]|nr:BamA/TamA family outer membrane protein [Muribaculaceae bacterium]
MRKNNNNIYSFRGASLLLAALFVLIVLVGACSTTRRLDDGEVLYTGMKVKINPTGDEKLPDALVSQLKQAVDVRPNNPIPLITPYIRSPFQYGLWVYNYWNDSAKGVYGWLYRKLAEQPVLISDVRAQTRMKMVENILANNGYFGSTATFEEIPNKKDPKKASMSYTFDVSSPYRIDSIIYLNKPKAISHFIDSLAHNSSWLKKGSVFCVDSLTAMRVNITNQLRNRGYYYFRPEFIEFLADTFITPHAVALKLDFADNINEAAKLKYRTRNIVTLLERNEAYSSGTPDTLLTDKGEVIVMRPQRLRKSLIPSCITFRKGKVFSVRDMDRTQTRLSRIGIFSNIQIQPVPADTSARNPLMDVYITCRYDRPMEASIEVNATSKSNSYIGPGLIASFSHNNLFGGAEKLSVSLNADYEWQTGRDRSNVFNSYEFGLQTSLAFPRLLAPKFIPRSQRDLNWTTISLGGSVLNRPKYFMMAEYNMGITYEWRATRHSVNSFTPFKLTYNKLIHTTADFDSVMAMNPAVALSFESRFIPQLSYTYTYDRWFERERNNQITFTALFTEAGNLFDAIYDLAKVKGEKKLFGTPFSQFVKGQVQLVWNHRLFPKQDQWIVSRILLGAAHAYGNSKEVPYSEQFYIGGANSIRAFTVRSIGPGSYRAPRDLVNGYFDQTGTFKFEINSEYRFPIFGDLHGAAFIDAGNIWLLKNDPYRPGGLLQAKTFLKDIALGTGAGLRYDFGMMVVRLDVGYGLHTPYSNGTPHYFNVRFKDAFAFHLALGYPF